MKKILLTGCIMLFVFCASRKTTIETEGLEEVIVFGEEETYIIEEPVYPEEEMEQPEEVAVIPPPIEEPIEEPIPVIEEPIEEPIPVVEEPTVHPPVEETPPPMIEEPYVLPVTTPPPPTLPPIEVFGFRIQVFASSAEKNADRVAVDARSVLAENIYVNYVVPYYKVRVGDCLTYEDAMILKNRISRLGYHGAFIVETMITP